jgi:hypothetical protein
VRQIIARYSPELANRATYHNTELRMPDAGAGAGAGAAAGAGAGAA